MRGKPYRVGERLSDSWIIVSKETGDAVLETHNSLVIDNLNLEKYEAMPTLDYLQMLNKKIASLSKM